MLTLGIVVRSDAEPEAEGLRDLLGLLEDLMGELRELVAGELEYPVNVRLDGDTGDVFARLAVEE